MPNARNAQRKAIHMLQRSSHTKLTNHRLLEGRQKGLDTTDKRAKVHKTHKLSLNSSIKAKEQKEASVLTMATHLKVTNSLTFIISSEVTYPCPPSSKVMYLHVTTGV
jgi:oligoribonuclease NrnB/cAMP/cGMP phosphodiesterase (DHH superfamily)